MNQLTTIAQTPTAHSPNIEAVQTALAPESTQETPTADTTASQRSIEELTNVILSEKGQIAYSFIEIGNALIEAKEQLIKHGRWLKWLSDVVDIPPWTAERYMKLARSYPNSTAVQNIGMTKALVLLSVPENRREEFINNSHDVDGNQKHVDKMTSRELRLVIKKEIGSNNSDDTKSKMKPFTKDNMRKDFLSNLDTSIKSLKKEFKFYEMDEGNTEITEEFRKSLDSITDVAEKCKERINSKISTEKEENL